MTEKKKDEGEVVTVIWKDGRFLATPDTLNPHWKVNTARDFYLFMRDQGYVVVMPEPQVYLPDGPTREWQGGVVILFGTAILVPTRHDLLALLVHIAPVVRLFHTMEAFGEAAKQNSQLGEAIERLVSGFAPTQPAPPAGEA